MKVYGTVYLIINGTNDKEYVGQTTKTVEKRFNQHKRGDQYIDHVIRAHGADLFTTAILKVCYSQAELNFWERHMIRSHDTKYPNGYNLTDGGEGAGGLKHTPEHNAKIATALTGKSRPLEVVIKFAATKRFYSPYKNLIREIEKHKLTYDALKKCVGLANVSDKMRGECSFTAKDANKLVEFFGKSAEYLLTREDGLSAIKSKAEKASNQSAAQRGYSPYKNLLAEVGNLQLTYSLLAELLGLARRTLSQKVHGEIYFTEKDIAKLVEIFDKSAEYLMQREDGLSATTSKAAASSKLSITNRQNSPYKNLLNELENMFSQAIK